MEDETLEGDEDESQPVAAGLRTRRPRSGRPHLIDDYKGRATSSARMDC